MFKRYEGPRLYPKPTGKCVYCQEDVKRGRMWTCNEHSQIPGETDGFRYAERELYVKSGICPKCRRYFLDRDSEFRNCERCRTRNIRRKPLQEGERERRYIGTISEVGFRYEWDEDETHEYSEAECKRAFAMWEMTRENALSYAEDERGRCLMILGETYLKPVMEKSGRLGCAWIHGSGDVPFGYRRAKHR